MGFDTEGAKNQKPKPLNIYVPPNKQETVKKAKEYFKREGTKESLSSWVIKQISRLVELHDKGNNQQFMTRYFTHTFPYIAPRKCFRKNCPNPASTTGICNNVEYAVCTEHAKFLGKQTKSWKITNKKIGV